jgi:hypothetical protein
MNGKRKRRTIRKARVLQICSANPIKNCLEINFALLNEKIRTRTEAKFHKIRIRTEAKF